MGRQQPLVDDLRGKLREYALNPDHEEGGKQKAEFFRRELGIEQDDWKLLAVQLISALRAAELLKLRDGQYGDRQQLRFEISALVVGLNGKTKPVTAAWQILDDAPTQLITITPGKKIKGAPAEPDTVAPGDWDGLYKIALTVADRALQECRPTPLAVGGPDGAEVIPEGIMGFAWVYFPDARTALVQWLLRTGHAHKSHPGAQISAPTFDLEPAAAWAEAMAGVLQAAGHPCSVTQETD